MALVRGWGSDSRAHSDWRPASEAAAALVGKLVPPDELPERIAALPRPLVFTNGVFDLLHRGHVTYLAEARALGAALVVAVNGDQSVRVLGKGADRPINAEEDRALVLAGLASVSAVARFDERKPLAILSACRPDIYVKGGDYDIETLEETALVRSWGGAARSIRFVPGYSTTAMLRRSRPA